MVKISSNDTYETKIIEVNPSYPQTTGTGSEVVFECTVPNAAVYRTFRAGLYDGYSEEDPYLSTALNDTTGNDLVDRSVMAWRDLRRWTTPLRSWLKKVGRQINTTIK